jgi:hypothetical protein
MLIKKIQELNKNLLKLLTHINYLKIHKERKYMI